MKRTLYALIASLMLATPMAAQDLMQDTWVGTDALGRKMPTSEEVGLPKQDKERVVGMFYITWHDEGKYNVPNTYRNVAEVLAEDPEARFNGESPAWPKGIGGWHWGEPEYGYFLSQDRYVIRHDMSMLTDAGVDVLIMDVTNAVCYWDEWEVLFSTMEEMKREGNKVPQICFWTFNGPAITVSLNLYERIYKAEKYKDLWFYWDGKPLLLCNKTPWVDSTPNHPKNHNPHYDAAALTDPNNPHYGNELYTTEIFTDYPREMKAFFTMRGMWWGYYKWDGDRYVGTEDAWSFGYEMQDPEVAKLSPLQRASKHLGKIEEMAVTPAQHPISITGKSWRVDTKEPALDERDSPAEAYVPWLGKTVKNPEGYGIYFQDRWDEALSVDPAFIYLNDWNEWTAGKYAIGHAPGDPAPGPTEFLGRKNNTFYFVDQYNSEFNRTIEPVKGLYTDNYYMQMAQNIRRYKGARPIPRSKGLTKISVDGQFTDWQDATVYYDTRGDIAHRDHNGYAGRHYTNTTGRNDIVTAKVAVDKKNVYFYVETAGDLTAHTDKNWMLLFIDADQNSETGWYGYDFIVNYPVKDATTTTVAAYDAASKTWKEAGTATYRKGARQMELSIARKLLNLRGKAMTFDFKWADNPQSLTDPIALCTDGDTAPNRRFNYRFIWNQ